MDIPRTLFIENAPLLTDIEKNLIDTIYAIKQQHIFAPSIDDRLGAPRLLATLDWLQQVDTFFSGMGGIRGMQKAIEELQHQVFDEVVSSEFFNPYYLSPSTNVDKNLLEHHKDVVEVIVLGGAAQRLNFFDPSTHEPLPAFLYPFLGKPLLEWFFLDIQANERLFFDVFQESITIPIVLMSSSCKNNKKHLVDFLEKHNYFGRTKESILVLEQPLVPCVDKNGDWLLDKGFAIEKNPCGHGAIWNLLRQSDEFRSKFKHKRHILIRQINNPILCFFSSSIAFVYAHASNHKKFSILVTDPKENTKEGKIIKTPKGYTNLEYTVSSNQNPFGYANVNAIVCDMATLLYSLSQDVYPGLLLNFKDGQKARLEMSMQNLIEYFEDPLICHLPRDYAISAIKKGGEGLETAHQASLDLFAILKKHMLTDENNHDILSIIPYQTKRVNVE
jgi:hypothetical protein